MKSGIGENVRLDPNSIAFNLWKDIPVPFFMSVYFFEVLNPNEVLRGAKPMVNQRGPYVYREYRVKDNITFNDNDTVSFMEYRQFHFQADMSNGSESDYVVVPNMLVMGAAVMLEDLPFAVKLTISSTFAFFKQSAFMNRTVGEVMWGYDDPLIDFLNSIKPGLIPFKGKFGLFADFNNSNTGLFTVYTGMANISRTHMVDRWNGLKKVSYWNSDQCNMINGTSGELWPPFVTPTTPLEFYSPDACRSMTLIFNQSGEFKGVPTNRYLAPKTLFANGTDYPPNEGFCPCLQSGIQNVSSCRLNAPVFISHPHFLNADPFLLEAVGGLHPNEEEHGLFLDIHPSGEIEGSVLNDFYMSLVLIPNVLGYVQYCLVALGGVLLIAAALFGLKSKNGVRMKPSFSQQTLTVLRQKEGSIVIGTLSAPKFYNSGSSTGYSYQGPQRDAQKMSVQTPNLWNDPFQPSDKAPLLQEDSSTIHNVEISTT
ncbi:hypothetical protein JD844_014855 [Phrynosoma platyrhinos]|uniref:Scavenger receptor class B member 1 n=1 Tax=Phrynosoma platyrhinos TaxID=52577 RepID=A0ABQ7T701_PHRPL|nr:hypothetical protein JD844_014855 [Phrynosoma platyrhinos]